ncbi:MAG: multiheme c-type cytochrome [Planctomycetota bacterium]
MEANDSPTRTTQGRRALVVLAALALVACARVAQLVGRDASGGAAEPPALVDSPCSAAPLATGPLSPSAPLASHALSDKEARLLAMACPQSLEQMPAELRAAFTRVAPAHRLTAAREPAGQWLVEPERWWADEDQRAGQVKKEPIGEDPIEFVASPTESTVEGASVEDSRADDAVEGTPVDQTMPQATPKDRSLRLPAEPLSAATPPPAEPTPIEPPSVPLVDPLLPAPMPGMLPTPGRESTEPAARLLVVEPPAAAAPMLEFQSPPPDESGVSVTGPDTRNTPVPPTPKKLPTEPSTGKAEPEVRARRGDQPPIGAAAPQSDAPTPPAPLFTAPKPAPAAKPPEPLFREPVAKPPADPLPPKPLPPVSPTPPAMHATTGRQLTPAEQKRADESHAELFAENCYPSARACAKCHKKQYEEWSMSSHAYAFVSPMFHKFEQKIVDVSRGTVGYFCMRCHSPTSVEMSIPRDTPLWDMPEVAREGVTCIACHRVNEVYSKTNGERRIVPGDVYAPVYGGVGGEGVARAIADKGSYKVKTSPKDKGAGQPIHTEGRFFKHLSEAEFCTTCHQVAVHPGIKLEVVWEQYRASPACKKGVTCQHCHMGAIPGVASPYEIGPIAEVGGKTVNDHRRHANHVFYGPGYSIAHPGVFPFHKDGNRWRVDQWLLFDWRAGWGTDDFEDAVADGRINPTFPDVWKESDDRCDAREIIDDNIARLGEKRAIRKEVMENGTKVTGPYFRHQPVRGRDLKFDYIVTNINEGHNILTASLGAQPQLWANVVLIDPDGHRVWETGYIDRYGDLADIHSVEVRRGRLPFDSQLFNLQTMFLITGATGTDREFFLPVNISIDQLPQLRPGAVPVSVLNHPPFIRMESRSMPPLGSKRVKYTVPGERITKPGRYRLSFRMRNRTEPIYFMRFCEATVEMQRAMNEGILDVHPYSVEFVVQ